MTVYIVTHDDRHGPDVETYASPQMTEVTALRDAIYEAHHGASQIVRLDDPGDEGEIVWCPTLGIATPHLRGCSEAEPS